MKDILQILQQQHKQRTQEQNIETNLQKVRFVVKEESLEELLWEGMKQLQQQQLVQHQNIALSVHNTPPIPHINPVTTPSPPKLEQQESSPTNNQIYNFEMVDYPKEMKKKRERQTSTFRFETSFTPDTFFKVMQAKKRKKKEPVKKNQDPTNTDNGGS